MASVTDQEIAEGITGLFRETNPNSFTSLNEVILRLQSKLGVVDLSHKVDFIRAQIALFFSSPPPPPTPVVLPQNPPNPNPNLNIPTTTQQYHHVVHPQHHQHHVTYHQHHPQHQHQQHHSHFGPGFGGGGPRGPTEISFAQPGGGVLEPHSSPVTAAKESTQARPKRRGGPGGLNKLCGVSPLLQTIVGQPAMPRTEIVKQLWAYIRKNNLQDPSNKRKIICNDELRLVFETDSTDMFQMNKLLAKHIVPLDTSKDVGQQSKKLKVEDSQVPAAEPAPTPAPVPDQAQAQAPAQTQGQVQAQAPAQAAGSSPSMSPASAAVPAPAPTSVSAPIVISEALAKFLGTSEKEMLQSEVYKRIEEYIKVEGLEDPLNSLVICDTKLQELFGCESIPTPGIREVLARNHLFQRA